MMSKKFLLLSVSLIFIFTGTVDSNSIEPDIFDNKHFQGANWHRDVPEFEIADLRTVSAGDPSPCGKGVLDIKRGIEVGHIFQLGTKYSEAMGADVLDQNGKSVPMSMGCYGIGITRIVAAAIEQNHDDRGIIWPKTMAPFTVVIIPLGMDKSDVVASATEAFSTSGRKWSGCVLPSPSRIIRIACSCVMAGL